MSQFLDEASVCRSFLRSRAAPTRPKSEKPRKSREGKRSKRFKRHQPERKEKYRKRQCRANHEQHHELSKLSATHDVQRQRSGEKFHGGASHTAPNPTLRKRVTAIMLRIRLRRYRDALGKNNSAARPPNVARFASSLAARGRTQRPLPGGRQPGCREVNHTTGTHDCLVETLRTPSAGTATASSRPSNRTAINSSLSSSVL